MTQVRYPAQELLHVMGIAKREKKKWHAPHAGAELRGMLLSIMNLLFGGRKWMSIGRV